MSHNSTIAWKSLVCIVDSQNYFVKELIIWKKFQNYKGFRN